MQAPTQENLTGSREGDHVGSDLLLPADLSKPRGGVVGSQADRLVMSVTRASAERTGRVAEERDYQAVGANQSLTAVVRNPGK